MRMTGRFYVAVVQAVLLFGSEMWVLTPQLEKALEGFHHRAERRMAVMGPKRQPDGTWLYPPIGAALTMVGLEEIGVYISRRQNTVAQYIANHLIMDLCLAAEQNPGMRLSSQLWEQPALDITGIRAATCPALILVIPRAGCSHHPLDRRIPRFRSATSHKSMMGRVTMYCVTMFWRRAINTPISSSRTISRAAPMGGSTHVPSG